MGEHYLDAVGVRGSNPRVPTISNLLTFGQSPDGNRSNPDDKRPRSLPSNSLNTDKRTRPGQAKTPSRTVSEHNLDITDLPDLDPDLALVVSSWPDLDADARTRILSLVNASKGKA